MTRLALGVAVVALGILILIVRGRHDFTHGHRARGILEFIGAALGVTFAGLTFWTTKLPVLHGSMWSLKDTLIKAGAILSGVLFMLSLLTAILPWLLDRLEGRTFSSFVGARHVRSQKSGFLTVISA